MCTFENFAIRDSMFNDTDCLAAHMGPMCLVFFDLVDPLNATHITSFSITIFKK